MRTVLLAGAAAVVLLAGCGEREQVVMYKQGQYQGKQDAKPWDSSAFGGDRAKWEASIKSRNQYQNEYKRIPG